MKIKIPSAVDWSGYESDLDVIYFHKLAFEKGFDEILQYFIGGRSIERADELLYCPRKIFQYYIKSFTTYLESATARSDSDGASSFLWLLLGREERDPGSVAQVYSSLKSTIDFIASNQEYFDANIEIYGSFQELAAKIKLACNG